MTTPTTPQSNGIAPFPRGTTQITQAPMITQPIRPPDVVYRLAFASETVKRLSADDFDINSKELVTLKYDDCILILFHTENTESYQLANIWALVAQQVAGPVFAAINMITERKLAEAFTRLKSDGSHPLHWASIRQYPFIMVYRKKWPVAVYNGPREVQALIDYSLTLACEAGYYETLQLGGGMQGEARIEMGPYQPYINTPGQPPVIRGNSLQYNASEPIRGFNPNIPVVITGSTGARSANETIRTEEQNQRQAQTLGINTSLTENAPTSFAEQVTGEQTASQQAPPLQPLSSQVATPVTANAPIVNAPTAVTNQATPVSQIATPVAPGTRR